MPDSITSQTFELNTGFKGSRTPALNCSGFNICRVQIEERPSAITAAVLTLQVRLNGLDWQNYEDSNGTGVTFGAASIPGISEQLDIGGYAEIALRVTTAEGSEKFVYVTFFLLDA